ncbi:MAG: restriction endonuclease subunit S [Proteobacteria bacterium]|nr:restriction endonuclease subunit S [Desulfobulbaceae bacterium]MBU4151585.1 restriction endonuclease subunit S [Pseudomonadota bacterium]
MSELPLNWCEVHLCDIATTVSGVGFPLHYQGETSGALGFYKVGDISRAVLKHAGQLHIPQHFVSLRVAAELKGKPIPSGATVFAKIGEAIKLNRRAIVTDECLIDNNVMAVKAFTKESDRYLYMFLRTQDFTELSRATTVPSLRKGDIESLVVPLPPLNEQQRIADKLDAVLARVDACHERLDRVPAILKRFRQAVLSAATSGRLTEEWREVKKPQSIGTSRGAGLFDIPECWTWTLIDSIAEVKGGKRLPKGEKLVMENTGFPYIKAGQLKKGTVQKDIQEYLPPNIQKLIKRYIVNDGDVYITIVGACIGDVGVIPLEYDNANLTENAAKICNFKNVANDYLAFWLRSPVAQNHIDFLVKSGAQGKLALMRIKEIPVPLPTLEEQQEIVRRVEALFAYADRLEARYATARAQVEQLTPSLLAKAFRGELVPQDPNDEPASLLLERIQAFRAEQASKPKQRKTVRRPKVTTLSTETLRAIIESLPAPSFTFDELRSQVSADYETLKDLVFKLLTDPKSGIKQVFDVPTSEMRFQRVRT